MVRGHIVAPDTVDEARAMLTEWDDLRQADKGNLFGVFTRDQEQLVGVAGLRLSDDFVAELAAWNIRDGTGRKLAVTGLELITETAHRQMGIVRLWIMVDSLDPYAKYLGSTAGYSREAEFTQPNGDVTVRYSSLR